MAQGDKARHKKPVLILGGVVIVGGLYIYMKRKKAATTAAATPSSGPNGIFTSNNAAVAAQTANPGIITITPGSGNNWQGNYGQASNTSFMQALSSEAALSKQLSLLQSQPHSATSIHSFGGTSPTV